jgi:3-oxoacyl-[acyl-carrier protein] reductase
MEPLIGQVAIVTGASRGIGRAIAERLAQDGATVVINYNQSQASADEAIAQIQSHGGQAIAVQADVSKVDDIRNLFQQALNEFGHIDILVNNTGIAAKPQPIAEVTEENFDAVFAVNVKGVLFALQEAARYLTEGGRIINISSSTTLFPTAGLAVYTASKAVPKVFTEIMAKEVGDRGITVNSVIPGPTIPGMFEWAPPEFRAQAATLSPFKRLGTPEDIADVVAFLASDQARWITGQHILVNGGATI